MGLNEAISREDLVAELQRDLSRTLLLYTVDGYAYYARIKEFVDKKIALLVPGAGQLKVIIRHPDQTFCPQGTSIIREDFTYLDLSTVVAITESLSMLPFGFVLS